MPLKTCPEIADVHDYAGIKPDRLAFILCEHFKKPGKITATTTFPHDCAHHPVTREQSGAWCNYQCRAGDTIVHVEYRPDRGGQTHIVVKKQGVEIANWFIDTLKCIQQ